MSLTAPRAAVTPPAPHPGSSRSVFRSAVAVAVVVAAAGLGAVYSVVRLGHAAGSAAAPPPPRVLRTVAPATLSGLAARGRPVTVTIRRYRPGGVREALAPYERLARRSGVPVKTFALSGASGGQGVSVTTGHHVAVAALFPDGRFYETAGARFPAPAHAPGGVQLSAAAGWLYLAAKGCAAPAHHARRAVVIILHH